MYRFEVYVIGLDLICGIFFSLYVVNLNVRAEFWKIIGD